MSSRINHVSVNAATSLLRRAARRGADPDSELRPPGPWLVLGRTQRTSSSATCSRRATITSALPWTTSSRPTGPRRPRPRGLRQPPRVARRRCPALPPRPGGQPRRDRPRRRRPAAGRPARQVEGAVGLQTHGATAHARAPLRARLAAARAIAEHGVVRSPTPRRRVSRRPRDSGASRAATPFAWKATAIDRQHMSALLARVVFLGRCADHWLAADLSDHECRAVVALGRLR